MSSALKPSIFGIEVSVHLMWVCLIIAHLYFFVMWRLTSSIEGDSEKKFFNLRGIWKQAVAGGTKAFPGKTKAQLLLIRALPIWIFIFGLAGMAYGLAVSLINIYA